MDRIESLIELWKDLPVREGERLPRRNAIPIGRIAPLLPWCWQMRWQGPVGYVIVFFGEKMIDAWGLDPTGEDIFRAVREEDIRFVTGLIARLYGHPCGAVVTRELPKGEGGRYRLTNCTLPMLDNNGNPTAIFGTSVLEAEHQERPYSGKLDFTAGRVTDARFVDLGSGVPDDGFLPGPA